MHQNLTLKAFVQSCRHHSLVKCLHFLFLFCCIFHFGQESFAENFYLVQKDRFLEEADQHHQQFYAQSLSTDRRKIVEIECNPFTPSPEVFISFIDDLIYKYFPKEQVVVENCHQLEKLSEKEFTFPHVGPNYQDKLVFKIILLNNFDRFDYKSINEINNKFVRNGIPKSFLSRTASQQHGHKTKKVIVYVHGLGMTASFFREEAIKAFNAGHNVIVANIPGHYRSGVIDGYPTKETWTSYVNNLALLAKNYGDEIIFVGHSLGAQLVIRLAEQNLVDKIILIEPLVGVTYLSDMIKNLALNPWSQKVAETILPSNTEYYLKHFMLAADQALQICKKPNNKIPTRVKVTVYLSDGDLVVNNKKTVDWLLRFAPHAEVITEPTKIGLDAHMLIPESLSKQIERMN